MNQHNKPPLVIFGIPLRSIVIAVVFLIVLLSLFNPFQIKQSIQGLLKTTEPKSGGANVPMESPGDDIKATREMISKAARDVQAERIRNYESEQELPTKVNYYLVNLADGGSIEAESVSIKPDKVTVITAQGIETVIPRQNIRNIVRLKLDPKPSPEAK